MSNFIKKKMLWWRVILLLCAIASSGRRLTGSFRVSATEKEERVYYISKFACSIGECKYNVRAGIKHPEYALQKATGKTYYDVLMMINQNKENNTVSDARMVIRVVLDDEWDTSHNLSPCQRAELGRGRTTLSIPLDGTLGPWSTNSFRQTHRPHFWYFFAEDCRNSITTQLAKLTAQNGDATTSGDPPPFTQPYELLYEIEMLQTDGGHLSFELTGMLLRTSLEVIFYTLLLGWMHYKQIKVMKSQRFSLHIMVQILNGSCIFHLAASIFSCLHLYQVNKTGASFNLLEGISDGLYITSHIAITSCLILIALGVTLNAPQNRFSMTIIKVIGCLICAAHLLVVLIDKYTSDPRYKYYGTEGAVGWILILFRISLYIIYIVCFKLTIKDPRTPASTQRFLRKIFIPSSVYFLTLPILVGITRFLKPYQRHCFLYHSMTLTHIIGTIWLSELFLSKGEYFKVSEMSQSFLPGGMWKSTVAAHHVD